MKLESHQTAEDKRRYKLVRCDNFVDVPGEIVTADEVTGEACMLQADGKGGTETKTLSFGAGGFRIVGRRR